MLTNPTLMQNMFTEHEQPDQHRMISYECVGRWVQIILVFLLLRMRMTRLRFVPWLPSVKWILALWMMRSSKTTKMRKAWSGLKPYPYPSGLLSLSNPESDSGPNPNHNYNRSSFWRSLGSQAFKSSRPAKHRSLYQCHYQYYHHIRLISILVEVVVVVVMVVVEVVHCWPPWIIASCRRVTVIHIKPI